MFDSKTKVSLSRLCLGGALLLSAWVIYDAYQRFLELHADDQEFYFSDGTVETRESEMSMAKVIDAHLFGVVPNQAKIQKPKFVDAPKTRLNMRLTGIVKRNKPDGDYAMIEIPGGQTGLITAGNEIGETGAELHAIENEYVLIDHRGKIEKLALAREIPGFRSPTETGTVIVEELNLSESELAALAQVTEQKITAQSAATQIFADSNIAVSVESSGSGENVLDKGDGIGGEREPEGAN